MQAGGQRQRLSVPGRMQQDITTLKEKGLMVEHRLHDYITGLVIFGDAGDMKNSDTLA